MAGLPTAQMPDGVRALPTPYDSPDVSAEQMGAGSARALQGLSQTVAAGALDVARKAKQDATAAAIADSEAQMVRGIDQQLHDPEKGFLFQRGKAAQDAMTGAQDAIKKLVNEQIAKAADPEQKRILQARAATLLNDANRTIQVHVGKQIDVMAGDAYKARIDAGMDAVANAWADPTSREQALAKLRPFVELEAKRQGLPPEAASQMWVSVQKAAAARVAQQFLARNLGDAAQQFLASPLISGQKQTAMEVLGDDSARFQAQAAQMAAATAGLKAAVEVASHFRIPGTNLIDQGRAERDYQARYFGKVSTEQYQHGLSLLREQISMGESAAQSQNGRDYNVALAAFQKGGTTALTTDPAAAAAVARLRAPNNTGGASLWDALQKHQTNPPPTPEQDAAFGRARAAIVADEWQRYAQMDPDQVRAVWAPQVTRGQMEQISALHAQAKERLLNKDKFGMPGVVDQEVVALGKKAGAWTDTDKKKWKDENWAAYNAISAEVDRREKEWWSKNSVPPSAEDYRSWVRPMLVKGTVKGSGFVFDDSTARARALTDPKYQGKPFETEVPSATRKQLIEKFKARGVPNPTDAQIRAAYEATLAAR